MTVRFEFRSNLAETPLPEVLETINRYRVPGVIECSREGWARKIFILDGEIIFATSNNLYDSLGDFLLRKKRIDRTQYDESVARLKATKRRQGQVLVDMGLLTPKTLFTSVVDQVQEIVWDSFEWFEGDVAFNVGRYKDDEVIKLNIPTRRAILRGILGMTDAKRIVTRLGGATAVWVADFAPEQIGDLELDERELAFLGSIDGKQALKEVAERGPGSPAHNTRLLYAFSCLRLIKRKEAIRVHWRTTGGEMGAFD